MEKVKCPKCGKPNEDNWPLTINEKVTWGGCQDCWETESSQMYWSFMKDFWELIKEELDLPR